MNTPDPDLDFERDLPGLFGASAGRMPAVFPAAAASVPARYRRRRRIRLAAGLATALVLAGTGVAVIPRTLGDSQVATVVPAAEPTTPAARDTFHNVAVTWLPDGIQRTGLSVAVEGFGDLLPRSGHQVWADYSRPGELVPSYTVIVQDSEEDLDPLPTLLDRSGGNSVSETTVQGRRAVLTELPGEVPHQAALLWNTGTGSSLMVTADGEFADDVPTLRRIAEGLRVVRPVGPADPGAASEAVRAVVRQTLTSPDLDEVLDARVDGESLRTIYESMLREHPRFLLDRELTITEVMLLSPTDAVALYKLTRNPGDLRTGGPDRGSTANQVHMVLTSDGWKVAAGALCQAEIVWPR